MLTPGYPLNCLLTDLLRDIVRLPNGQRDDSQGRVFSSAGRELAAI